MLEIVGGFIDQRKESLRLLQKYLAKFKDVYQFVYSHVYPEVYCVCEKRGFDLKSNFHILSKAYRDKMFAQQQSTAKNPANYQMQNQQDFEQKSLKNFDQFTDTEEKEIKEQAEKRNAERCQNSEEVRAKKRKEQAEEKETEMWKRLNELNGQFKKINNWKKEEKQKLPLIIK